MAELKKIEKKIEEVKEKQPVVVGHDSRGCPIWKFQ
jgi:hypothetical protein